jgi:hypothetical protein
MGTCNYIIQSDFDLYTIEYKRPTQEEIENFIIATGEMFDEDFDTEIFYYDMYRDAERLADRINKELIFYKIKIGCGYYNGIQTFVDQSDWDYYNNVEDMDNDACKYYFGMCRSKAIRKYKAEVKRINKRLLPKFKTKLDFDRIICVGVFSNGNAIYERIK